MVYLMQVAEKGKKIAESTDYSENQPSFSNVESLEKKRKSASQAKARQKVLNASSKINW